MITDKMRIENLALGLGDICYSRPRSVIVPAWGRRFVFDEDGVLVRLQDILKDSSKPTGYRYETVSTVEEGLYLREAS